MLEDASATMMRLSGGAAVCTFTRAGKAVPGIKYAEGRWAALRDVERRVAKGGALGPVLAASLERWCTQQSVALARGVGRDWVAYHEGTVDAVAELAERLGIPTAGGTA